MSLAINLDEVEAVMLLDHQWYKVIDHTFIIDSYEFVWDKQTVIGGGQVPNVSATCAAWKTSGKTNMVCPFTSIIALRCTNIKKGS